MRPLLQRRAAARLAAALLTPFIPELRQQPALAISATTMSGKTRPDTGCMLVNEPAGRQSRQGAGRVRRIGNGGRLRRNRLLRDALVPAAGQLLRRRGPEQRRATAPSSCRRRRRKGRVLQPHGSLIIYLASAAATAPRRHLGPRLRDERDRSVDGGRLLEYSFTALKGNAEVQRRAFVKAVSPPGSKDAVILVAGTTASEMEKENGEKISRAVVDSLRVSSSRRI